MPEEFVLRKAIPGDMERVFHLSNDPSVRENSIQEGTITWDEHVAWFSAMLEDPDHVFLVAETPQGELIGQVRFSRRNREHLVSISIQQWGGVYLIQEVLIQEVLIHHTEAQC